jgi:hypothetical protein
MNTMTVKHNTEMPPIIFPAIDHPLRSRDKKITFVNGNKIRQLVQLMPDPVLSYVLRFGPAIRESGRTHVILNYRVFFFLGNAPVEFFPFRPANHNQGQNQSIVSKGTILASGKRVTDYG